MFCSHFHRGTDSGIICLPWHDIKQAIRLEPDNVQYQMVLQQMEGGENWYQEMQNPFGGMPTGGDDYCMKLCLANMACSLCCPGSGIFCC